MKVLYIGHYKESTGWGIGALHHMMALKSVGVDVVSRNVQLTENTLPANEDVQQMEKNSLKNIDYCIQHILPFHSVGTKKFKKNVLFMPFESKVRSNNSFLVHTQNVDELWVPNNYNQQMLREAKVESTVVPYAFNLEHYKKERELLNFGQSSNKFKFYFIGTADHRKNIEGIVKCYLTEFDISDPVTLMLKISDNNLSPAELKNKFIATINNMKEKLRVKRQKEHYPEINILTDKLPEELIQSLHKTCDCYVGISHGEGWSIPAFEAMCYGNTPICTQEGGPMDFIDKNNRNTGHLVSSSYSVCDHENPAFDTIFTGNDYWMSPDELETKRAMRWYYENRNSVDKTEGIKHAEKYNYEAVGNRIKEALNA